MNIFLLLLFLFFSLVLSCLHSKKCENFNDLSSLSDKEVTALSALIPSLIKIKNFSDFITTFLNGNITIPVNIQGNLTVNGKTNIAGLTTVNDISIGATATHTGTVNVTGQKNITGNLTVGTDTIFQDISCSTMTTDNLTVLDSAKTEGKVDINNYIQVNNSAEMAQLFKIGIK